MAEQNVNVDITFEERPQEGWDRRDSQRDRQGNERDRQESEQGRQDQAQQNQIQSRLISVAYSNQTDMLRQLIEENQQSIDLTDIRDSKDFTLLHIACLNNIEQMAFFLLSHQLEKHSDRTALHNWVNAKTLEGYTALHFASFRGNINIIEQLIELRADLHCENYRGLTLLHVAAQGDMPVSLVYFKEKGLDIHQVDEKGSNALHWACFLGCENSVNYLVNWLPMTQDKEDSFSPLHLAVLSGNSRVVRKLLIKGASKHTTDRHHRTPIDLAQQSNYNNIVAMMQDQTLLNKIYNIRPAFEPMRRKKRSLLGFILFYLFGYLINFLFVLPYVHDSIWILLNGISLGLVLLFFIFCLAKNPGYISQPTHSHLDLITLLRRFPVNEICPDCQLLRPPRSKHCEFCRRCVSVYDHHCPWINNCVGAQNHGVFLVFLFCVYTNLVFQLLFLSWHISSHSTYSSFFPAPALTFIMNNGAQHGCYYILKVVFTSVLLLICVLFLMPLTYLICLQCKNFLLNQTTFERHGFNANKPSQINESTDQNDPLLSGNTEQGIFSPTNSNVQLTTSQKQNKASCQYLLNCFHMCCINRTREKYRQIQPLDSSIPPLDSSVPPQDALP